MKKVFGLTASVGILFLGYISQAQADGHVYAGFPVTLKGYSGDATTSVSYSGQVARQLLHNGLKKMVSKLQSIIQYQFIYNRLQSILDLRKVTLLKLKSKLVVFYLYQ